jgi:multicomponent Na+:H+ antiporter subunit F
VKIFQWIIGTIVTTAVLLSIAASDTSLYDKLFYCLTASLFIALWRALRGPTNFDRLLSFNASNLCVAAFCLTLAVALKKDIYIDIAIAWMLQNYLITLALTKYFEGRELDD